MFTLHPVLPMRAALVAGAAAMLGLLALASLSPTAERPRVSVVEARSAGQLVREPIALARTDSLTR